VRRHNKKLRRMSATSTAQTEKITNDNILKRLKELEGYCSSLFGGCAILLSRPTHRWPAPTAEEAKADPLINKLREDAVLKARRLWGFLVDLLDPSLAATLRNKGAIDGDSDDMVEAVSKLVTALKQIATGTSSNITLRLATLHKLTGMKCDINTDPQVFLDRFLLLKSHIEISDPGNIFVKAPEFAVMTAVNGMQTSIIGAQLLERVSKDGIHANMDDLIKDVTNLLAVKKQIAIAGGKPLAFVAINESEEEAYAVVPKSDENSKSRKPYVCDYCVNRGKTGAGHTLFLANGGIRCKEFARDRIEGKVATDEQCQASLDYVPKKKYSSNVNVRKVDKYSTLPTHPTPAARTATHSEEYVAARRTEGVEPSGRGMTWTSAHQNDVEESAYVDLTAYVSRGLAKTIVVADTGATSHLFNDERWFQSLHKTHNANVSGVGGTLEITHRGMTVFGMASYAKALPVSLLSTNQLHKERKGVEMEYDAVHNTFRIQVQGKWLDFRTSETLNVLHRIMTPIVCKEEAYMAPQFVDTQGALNMPQELILTKQQIDRGKAARRLHQALNHPGDTTLSRTLMRGHIADTPVTAKDIMVAEKILGPCPACKVSKATLQVRGGQYNHADEIGQHLRCDIAFIGGRKAKTPFHFAVEEKCGYRGIEKLKAQTSLALYEAQMKQINFYRARGFNPEKLYYDDGANVQGTKYMLQEQRILLNQWPSGQHEPMAESNTRVLNTDIRSVIVSLPYQMPEAMIPHLAVDVCNTRNALCNNKSGMETPYMLVEGLKPSAHSFRIPFGAIVIVSSYDKNIASSLGRSAYGIVCGRDFGVQHKCSVYMLHSRTVVHAAVTEEDMVRQPYPSGIIQLINETIEHDYDVDDLVVSAGTEDDWQQEPYSDTAVNVIRRAADAHMRKSEIRKTNASKKKQDEPDKATQAESTENHENENHPQHPAEVPVVPSDTIQENDRRSKTQATTQDNDDPYKRTYSGTGRIRSEEGRSLRDKRARERSDADFEDAISEHVQALSPERTTLQETEDKETDLMDVDTADSDETASRSTRSGKTYTALTQDEGYDAMLVAIKEKLETDEHALNQAWLMTLNGLLDLGPKGEAAVRKEIRAIIDHGSWRVARHTELSEREKRESISSFIFGKEKLTGETKARLVKNGKQLTDRVEYKDLLSPTSNPMTTMHHLAVAGHEKRKHLFTADFPNAYLKIDREKHGMPKEYTRLTGKLARLVCEEQPEYKNYMHNGCLFLEILRSVYGLTESAALWYKELSAMLIQLGYERQIADPCLFIHPGHKSAINIHVDDCMCSCTNDESAGALKSFFEKHKCKILTKEFLFLGMDIKHSERDGISLSMRTFLKDKLDNMGVNGMEKYPHNLGLLDEDTSEPLDGVEASKYVSRVMCLMYAGLRSRFDILYTLSCLSMHCQQPTKKNMEDLNHVLRYLNNTIDKEIKLSPVDMNIQVYTDASFMLHPDRKGHTGCLVTLGTMGPCIGAKSSKQKMLVLSSTEGEVLAVFESIPLLRMASSLNKAFGYNEVPVLHQDNKSAIEMMHAGGGASKHTKHFDLRLRYIQDMIQNHAVEIQHLGTDDMPADHLSKTTTGGKYERCMDALMGGKPKLYDAETLAMYAGIWHIYEQQTLRGCADVRSYDGNEESKSQHYWRD